MTDQSGQGGGYGGGTYGGGSYSSGSYGGGAPNQPPNQPPGQPPNQPPYGQGGGHGGGPSGPSSDAKGFFGALFDFSFNSFVTPKIVKVVYLLATILLAIALVVYIIIGFAAEPTLGVLALLFGWIPALLYLAFIRMTLEFYYSVVRMSQDINRRLPTGV